MNTDTTKDGSEARAKYLDKRQEAARHQVTVRTIDAWMKRGLIPYLRVGRTIRFDPVDVDATLRSRCRVSITV